MLDYHLSMLFETERMTSYRRAIQASVKTGDVVLDIGCGTGMLTFMACEAEQSGSSPRWLVGRYRIPEPADVLISETIGNAGLDEGILVWTFDARQRLLRPCAVLLPQRLRLRVAAAETFAGHTLVSDWSAPGLPYDYAAVHRRAARTVWSADISPSNLLGQPELAADIDLTTALNAPTTLAGRAQVQRDGTLHGLACWIDSLLSAGVPSTIRRRGPTQAGLKGSCLWPSQ